MTPNKVITKGNKALISLDATDLLQALYDPTVNFETLNYTTRLRHYQKEIVIKIRKERQ